MSRIADMGVRYSNFHTTALCSPTRASLLTGSQRHVERDGDDRGVQLGLPGHLDPDPVRERLHLRGAASSTATTPTASASGTSPRARRPAWPRGRGAGRWGAASSGSTASSAASRAAGIPTWSTTTTRSSPPATPEEGYHLAKDLVGQGDRVHPRREGRRARQAVLPVLLRSDAAHAPHHVFQEWADKYKGTFDERLRGDPRPRSWPGRRSSGCCPRTPSSRGDQPARRAGRHRPGRPALAAARHRAALGLAERRREAALRPDGRGVRRLRLVHRRPARPGASTSSRQSGELDNTIIVVVSDNGASGEGGPNGTFNEWRFFNGVADPDRR